MSCDIVRKQQKSIIVEAFIIFPYLSIITYLPIYIIYVFLVHIYMA